jgi:hypothetical protein
MARDIRTPPESGLFSKWTVGTRPCAVSDIAGVAGLKANAMLADASAMAVQVNLKLVTLNPPFGSIELDERKSRFGALLLRAR